MKTSSKLNEKDLKGLALFGAWVGLIGGIIGTIGGGLLIWDRLMAPVLQEVEALPVCVSEQTDSTSPSRNSVFGISVIVRCQAGSRTVFVSGLDLIGKKYLSVDEYSAYTGKKKMKDIEKEVAERKPYLSLLWSGWPEEQGVSVRIEPYEERYIRFIFLKPSPFHYFNIEGPPHLGYDDKSKEPDRIKTIPSLFDIFKMRSTFEKQPDGTTVQYLIPYGLRDDIKNGSLKFQLRVGSRQRVISSQDIIGFRLIELNKWKIETAQALFHEQPLGFRYNPNTPEGESGKKKLKTVKGLK